MKLPENYSEKCTAFVSEMVQFWPEVFDDSNNEEISGSDFLETFLSAAKKNGLTREENNDR